MPIILWPKIYSDKGQLRKRRNSYATDPDKKEKRKQSYQKHKQRIKQQNETERTEMLSLKAKRNNEKISKQESAPNILYKSLKNVEDLEKVFEKEVVLCDFCRDEYTPNAILVHIGKSKNCKSHYGEAYDKIKSNKGKIMDETFLAKKRERYQTDFELREKRKNLAKQVTHRQKNIRPFALFTL